MKIKIGALLVATFISGQVLANSANTSYVGVQFAQASYDESGLDHEFNPTAVVVQFGYNYTENFSLETRVGIGLSEDSSTINGVNASIEIDSLVGIYGVGHLPVSEAFSIYALAGYTRGQATVEANYMGYSVSSEGDDSGFSYGVGGQIKLGATAALTFEYTSYLDKSDYQITALGFGLSFRF